MNLIVTAFFVSFPVLIPPREHLHYRPDRSDTQPTSCRWQVVSSPSEPKGRLLGGTKVGNGAWGLAWVDTVMESSNMSERGEDFQKRERILREVNLAGDGGQEMEVVMGRT